MSSRKTHRLRPIVDVVIETKAASWNKATQQTARSDAQRVLEALVAEVGVEATIVALEHQGFDGDACRYLLIPLHEEAMRRRQLVVRDSNA